MWISFQMSIHHLTIVAGLTDLLWKHLKVKNIYMNYMHIESIHFISLIKTSQSEVWYKNIQWVMEWSLNYVWWYLYNKRQEKHIIIYNVNQDENVSHI